MNRSNLHHYQTKSIDFIKQNQSCALWCEMGLGKSISTLTALSDLFSQFEIGKVLIIAPLRVALNTWPFEIEKWKHTKHLTFSVVCGNRNQRLKALTDNTDIYIINRENITWLVEHFGDKWSFDTVVIDEASSFKSHRTKRFKSLKKVLHKIDRVIELTGTPASNGLLDVWSQTFLIDKGERLGKTYTDFRDRYFISDYMGYNWDLRPGSEEEIHQKLQDVCLTLSAKDYLEMPGILYNNIEINLDNKLKSKYRELEREFLLTLENEEKIAVQNAAVLSGKLLQFVNGALYTDDAGNYQILHNLKLKALEEVIEEAAGQPVLVAYNFKSDKERILKHFKQAVCIDAKDAIKKWNTGKILILVTHPASAGHGLNLQKGGNIIVWFGMQWSLEYYQQFNARLHRQGQEKPVFIHHLVATNTVDETVLDTLYRKNTTQKALLNALKQDIENRVYLG